MSWMNEAVFLGALGGTDPERVFLGGGEQLARIGTDPSAETASPALLERRRRYLRHVLPFVVALAQKVVRLHDEHEPRLSHMLDAVEDLAEVLGRHLDSGEKQLAQRFGARGPEHARARHGPTADEHREIARLVRRIRVEADGFKVPFWACTSYAALLCELEAFEGELLAYLRLDEKEG